MTKSNLSWKVTYKDGNVHDEGEIKYSEFQRNAVSKFSILSKEDFVVYEINIQDGESFAYRRRTAIGGNGTEICHIIMKFTPVGNKYAFIFDSTESIVIKDHFDNKKRWFGEIVFMEWENLGDFNI